VAILIHLLFVLTAATTSWLAEMTWQNTEKVGWVRLAFDRWEIPFDLIHKDNVQSGANLRSKYNVIIVPHQGTGSKSLVFEGPKLTRPLPYKRTDKFRSLGTPCSSSMTCRNWTVDREDEGEPYS
jgi:hypothetical protein